MRIFILLVLFFITPVHADALQDRSQLVYNCVYEKGLAIAGKEHPQGCVGLLRDPCIDALPIPGDANMMDCTGFETEAWDRLLNDVYGEARQTQLTADFNALRDRQRTWLKSRGKACALPDNYGTLDRLQSFGCFLDTTSARVLVLYEELGIFKR